MQYIKLRKPKIASIISKAKPKAGFELSEKQLNILRNTSQVLLALGIIAGAVTLTVLAPNAFQMLDKLPWSKKVFGPVKPRRKRLKKQEEKISKALYYLKSKKYIELIPKGSDFLLKVTRKGRVLEKRLNLADLRIDHSKRWNGEWWVVIADIPTSHKSRADAFRAKLKELGFYPLQRTVWVFPFDPRDEIEFLSTHLYIGRFVTTMRVSEFDPADDFVLKKFFRGKRII